MEAWSSGLRLGGGGGAGPLDLGDTVASVASRKPWEPPSPRGRGGGTPAGDAGGAELLWAEARLEAARPGLRGLGSCTQPGGADGPPGSRALSSPTGPRPGMVSRASLAPTLGEGAGPTLNKRAPQTPSGPTGQNQVGPRPTESGGPRPVESRGWSPAPGAWPPSPPAAAGTRLPEEQSRARSAQPLAHPAAASAPERPPPGPLPAFPRDSARSGF